MSERLLKIKLEELKTVLVICKGCKTACELPIKRLERKEQDQRNRKDICCPGCGSVMRLSVSPDHAPATDAFDRLADAWQALTSVPNFEVAFVVPDKDGDK